MPKKPTPAPRRDDGPKVRIPKNTKGLVLKGKKQVIKPVTLLDDGTPDLPHPRGVKKSPARSLTEEQMNQEARDRGGVATELERTKNHAE